MEWNGKNIWYCLKALRNNPCATWNDTYESIIWDDEENDNLSCPTKEEMEEVWNNGLAQQIQGLKLLRIKRNLLLSSCDYIMCTDVYNNLTTEKQNEWTTYRQALRDLTTTQSPIIDSEGDLTNVAYPTKPI